MTRAIFLALAMLLGGCSSLVAPLTFEAQERARGEAFDRMIVHGDRKSVV